MNYSRVSAYMDVLSFFCLYLRGSLLILRLLASSCSCVHYDTCVIPFSGSIISSVGYADDIMDPLKGLSAPLNLFIPVVISPQTLSLVHCWSSNTPSPSMTSLFPPPSALGGLSPGNKTFIEDPAPSCHCFLETTVQQTSHWVFVRWSDDDGSACLATNHHHGALCYRCWRHTGRNRITVARLCVLIDESIDVEIGSDLSSLVV